MNKRLCDFAEYVWSFYGPRQIYGEYFDHTLTTLEVGFGIGVYIERCSTGYANWGEGDSFDREHVRDIMLKVRASGKKEAKE